MRFICFSFAAVIAVGTMLLSLPFATNSGVSTPLVDCLFTATSATCVTGLIVRDTFTYWSHFGQVIIILLIQIGGLGLVTLTSFFSIAMGKKLGLREMQLAQESMNFGSMANITHTVKKIVAAVLGFEVIGALILCMSFVPRYGAFGIYISFFLAISAFCNAGFDVLGFEGQYTSLTNYNDDPIVLFTIMMLIIIGGLGFVVWTDLSQYHITKKLTLQTRVVLFMTGVSLVTGFLIYALYEWNNPETLGKLNFWEKISASLFQSVTTRTAGFNSIDISATYPVTKGLSSVLMFIGAAPGSTGGGIKITTVAIIVMTIVGVMRGREDTIIFGRRVPKEDVYKSITIVSLALCLVVASTLMIDASTNSHGAGFVDIFFEATSAFATVGLSSGVTAATSTFGRMVLIGLMYMGRVGPVSFGLSLFSNPNKNLKEITPVGKITVG